jgi:hypothetical protein
MARVPIEAFTDREVERVFIAGSLDEALHVEDLLTRAGIEYAVELERYRSGSILVELLAGEYPKGAVFYVLAGGQAAFCRSLLQDGGFDAGIIPPEPP